jgi:RNA polymerase sigma-70 factor (ECF subfamily)
MRSEQEANLAIEKYADTVRRICFVHLKNYHDTEDVFQDVFLKYVLHDAEFQSDAHEKAWLIRVAINACKDTLRSFFRKNVMSIEELLVEPLCIDKDRRDVLDAVLRLPTKYKDVIYLFYFEGYSALEIAALLQKKENTIYTWLSRAKAHLKTSLGGEPFEE